MNKWKWETNTIHFSTVSKSTKIKFHISAHTQYHCTMHTRPKGIELSIAKEYGDYKENEKMLAFVEHASTTHKIEEKD